MFNPHNQYEGRITCRPAVRAE